MARGTVNSGADGKAGVKAGVNAASPPIHPAPHSTPDPARLGRVHRGALVVLGGVLTLEAAVALVWPAWFSSSAPWPLTPLNARALAGYLGLLGLLMLSMAHENHRDRVRLVSPFLALLLPVVVVQLNRFPDQVDWGHPRIAISALLLTAVCALGISLAHGSWRRVLRE